MPNLYTVANAFAHAVCTFAVLGGLAGCGDKAVSTSTTDKQTLATLSVDGVGPLNAQTPFNLHRITAAFPGLNVTQQVNFTEGEQYPVILVSKDLRPLLSLNPDAKHEKLFSVLVHDNLIGNQLGHGLGTRYADIYAYGQAAKCNPGVEEYSGKVLCYAPGTGNILYLFSGSWNGPDGTMPPPEVLADWHLEALVWKPPRP